MTRLSSRDGRSSSDPESRCRVPFIIFWRAMSCPALASSARVCCQAVIESEHPELCEVGGLQAARLVSARLIRPCSYPRGLIQLVRIGNSRPSSFRSRGQFATPAANSHQARPTSPSRLGVTPRHTAAQHRKRRVQRSRQGVPSCPSGLVSREWLSQTHSLPPSFSADQVTPCLSVGTSINI